MRALSPGKEASLTARWGARIRSQIERQKRAMRGTRAAGRAIVRVTVAKDGHLQGVRLIRSSGNPALDGEALATVQRVRKFAAAPKELPKPAYSFDLPIKFGG